MPVTNANKKVVDLPFFEVMNFSPTASAAAGGFTTAEDGSSRSIYYLSGSTFYRYDIYADTYQLLSSVPTAPVTVGTMRYTRHRGYHGRVIAATSSSISIGGLRSGILSGYELEILSGTGAGQKRTITIDSETIHDSGVLSSTSISSFVSGITDSGKKWRINQWAGYTVGITYSNAATSYRRILYNDQTTLYVSDTNLLPHDPWGASPASSVALAVSTSSGTNSHYIICSQTYTLNSNWTVTPDNTSYFTVRTGGIYLLSALTSTPFFSLQYYDVANDVWYAKTVPQSLVLTSLSTDFSIDRPNASGAAHLSTTGTISGSSRTLVDAGLSLSNDRYANYRIRITGGTGMGQNRRIVGNTATTFTVAKPWVINPDSTSTYEVWPDYDRVWLAGGAASAMYAYSPENDFWMQGQAFDDGVITNIAATLNGWNPFGVSTGTRIAAGVTAVASTPTAGGTNYVVGDVLTLTSGGGAGAQVIVTSVAPGGIVTNVELMHTGTATGYTVGTGRTTSGGTGSGCTIEVTSVGATALITTATNHFLKRGDVVTFSGCSEAAYNTAHTIIGTPGITTFCIAITATANMAATASQSTTTIVDPTKNWTTNEHVGRLVHLCVAGTAPTSQIRWITANTATTLTVNTITAGANGTSKYAIYDSKLFGSDTQRRSENESPSGYATSGSTTTLVDSRKNWQVNQWAGYLFKIEAGTGYGSGRISIISNTATTLTFVTQSFTPDTTTKYEIADTWGLATAASTTSITETTTKNWASNQWIGKRVRISGGLAAGNEFTVTGSSSTSLSFGSAPSPDSTSSYALLGIQPRSTGVDLLWAWGGTDTSRKGKYMYLPRGGTTNQIDIYDITTGRWTYGQMFSPQSISFGTGTSYAYDGADTIYIGVCSANGGVTRVYALNINTSMITAFGQTTQIGGNIHIGNFMEFITSPDGVSYIYYLHNSSFALSRAMVF